MSLTTHYTVAKPSGKKEYNKDEIIDALMAEPLNIDINSIIETPYSVTVNMPRKDYIEKHIGPTISHKFNAEVVCRDEMLIIKMPGA